ncbi:MAG: CoA ester lyase [Novosphingobium sp.]|nr:CoA ester lyase [Novosphingobium sp.]
MSSSTIAPLRSALYMPGSNAKAIAKARGLACDAVILDLEDAVAPGEKEAARRQVADAVAAGSFGGRLVIVRVNGIDTPWGEADLAAFAAAAPDALLVPKVSTATDVRSYDALLASYPATTRLWVMIETARSLFNLADIADAAAATRLAAFVMGTNDLAKETGARLMPGRAAFAPQLSLAVAAAKMAGLSILDGVYNDLGDAAGFAAECRQALEFGFDGKTLIHPNQLDIANDAFSPTAAEIDFARAVIAAFAALENAASGALRVDGRMVERLHLVQCERLVAIADVLAATQTP